MTLNGHGIAAWWKALPDAWKSLALVALLVGIGWSSRGYVEEVWLSLPDRISALEARVIRLETDRRVRSVQWRYLECRAEREDHGLEPSDCRVILDQLEGAR